MEINLLVLNVGNSRMAIGVFVAGGLEYVARIGHEHNGDWAGRIADAWRKIDGRENAAIAGASVNPPLQAPVEQAALQATGQKVQWVGKELSLPIKVLTDHPNET